MSQEPSVMMLYGYELDAWVLNRVANENGTDYAGADEVMTYLTSKDIPCGRLGLHVEKFQYAGGERFFLGDDSSFRCASGWGVHTMREPGRDGTGQMLRAAMEILGAEDPDDPKWLMVVDFS